MTEQKRAPAETPPPEASHRIPDDAEGSVYRFITVAAKRARQLQSGARPKVHAQSRKLTSVAIDETRRGLVPFLDPETAPPPEEEPEEVIDQ